MKQFVKKLLLPGLLALLVWFTFSVHGESVHRLLSYVYDLDYHLAEACESTDYTLMVDDYYLVPVGECQTHPHPEEAAVIQAAVRYLCEADNNEILFIVVEMEEYKDGRMRLRPKDIFATRVFSLFPRAQRIQLLRYG